MEIKWDDIDPNTGKRRFVKAERFAGQWTFFCRRERRGIWEKWNQPSREMWEDLLESLERRLTRREGIELSDVDALKKMLTKWRDAPSV
ncbi:MAG TPA: hypothetical protein VHR66_09290 [Gemmataceae bacterium]|jgi:hypothetical protein|nr:hypothetical protein [Gemmataceae bacterium]